MQPPMDELLKLEKQICFPLYAASREVIKQYRPLLEKLDLTYTQYIVMLVFWEEKKLHVKDLGKRLFLDSGTLTPVLKSLEAKGFVHRQRSDEDERMLEVEITPAGLRLKEQATLIPMKIGHLMHLTPQEAIELYRLLYKMLGREV